MDNKNYYHFREEFHQYPELSGQEVRTAKRIIQILQNFSPTALYPHIEGNGILAEFCFGDPKPILLFRADIDAVSIEEKMPFPYTSRNPGVSHKCGHDGHITILLNFAELLHKHPLANGRIFLLFQPAEENGQGAEKIFHSSFFQQIRFDQVFALHNLPGYSLSSVICRPGSFTCSVISCTIRVKGKTAHAAEPEKGVSPTPALLKILQITQEWDNNQLDSPHYFRTALIELHIGKEAYGVAAGEGLIRLTFRAATAIKLQQRIHQLERLLEKLREEEQELQISVEWLESFTANENHPESVRTIREAAACNHLNYLEAEHPFAWGEDFGLFTQHYQGAMFGLGAGIHTPSLHSPDYDFPNEIIRPGARMFYEIARIACQEKCDSN